MPFLRCGDQTCRPYKIFKVRSKVCRVVNVGYCSYMHTHYSRSKHWKGIKMAKTSKFPKVAAIAARFAETIGRFQTVSSWRLSLPCSL